MFTKCVLISEIHQWHIQNHPLVLENCFWQAQDILLQCVVELEMTTADQQNLERWYGQQYYHCRHPICGSAGLASYRSASEREAHENQHSRPFLCPHPHCPYNVMGFATRAQLNRHSKKNHPVSSGELDSVNLDLLNAMISKPQASSPTGSVELSPPGTKHHNLEGDDYQDVGLATMGQTAQDRATPAHQLLLANGIDPNRLTPQQFAAFQAQGPSAQQKSIQLYAASLAQHAQRQRLALQQSPASPIAGQEG